MTNVQIQKYLTLTSHIYNSLHHFQPIILQAQSPFKPYLFKSASASKITVQDV